jgi:hypothetical protein
VSGSAASRRSAGAGHRAGTGRSGCSAPPSAAKPGQPRNLGDRVALRQQPDHLVVARQRRVLAPAPAHLQLGGTDPSGLSA